jgi:hypothetical protein
MVTAVREGELRISRPQGATHQWLLLDPDRYDRDDNLQPPSYSWVMERNLEGALRKGSYWPTQQGLDEAIEKYPKMAKGIREFMEAEDAMAFQEVDVLEAPVVYMCQTCGFEARSTIGLKSHQRAKHSET